MGPSALVVLAILRYYAVETPAAGLIHPSPALNAARVADLRKEGGLRTVDAVAIRAEVLSGHCLLGAQLFVQ